MPVGKYFLIKSRMHGLVLEIEGQSRDAGTPVVPGEAQGGDNDYQQWYMDGLTATIRSKMNDFCLDVNEDNTLIVNPFKPGDSNQQYDLAGDRLTLRENSLMVVDIAEGDSDPGARVQVYEYSGDDNQRWLFDYLEAEFFYIISQLSGLALGIRGTNREPGAILHMYQRVTDPAPVDNQLWYEDKEGRIRTKLNDFLIDNSKGAKIVRMYPEEFGNPGQSWIRMSNRVVSKFNSTLCIEIKKKSKKKRAEAIPAEYKGEKHQHWKFMYLESTSDAEEDFESSEEDSDN